MDVNDRLALTLSRARNDSKKSQDYVARHLGVSRKTIENWESGFTSPSLNSCLKYFEVLKLQPLPYFIKMLYGELEYNQLNTDDNLQAALIERIKLCTPAEQRKLLFILSGNHGSSSRAILDMISAHLHMPLKDRLNVTHNIITDYEIAKSHNDLVQSNVALPDLAYLKQSYEEAKTAVVEYKNSYYKSKE